MSQVFGADLGSVRIHLGGLAGDSARAVGAAAFTVGDHIVFGDGQFAPSSPQGHRLLAHELTHVLQQGPVGAASGSIRIGHPQDRAEKEAEFIGSKATDDRMHLPAYRRHESTGAAQLQRKAKPLTGTRPSTKGRAVGTDWVRVPWVSDHVTSLFNFLQQFDPDPDHALRVAKDIARDSSFLVGAQRVSAAEWYAGAAKAGSFDLDTQFIARWYAPPPETYQKAQKKAKTGASAFAQAEQGHIAAVSKSIAESRKEEKEHPGRKVEETQPVSARWKVLEGNAALAKLYLDFLTHFGGADITAQSRSAASNGLSVSEITAIVGTDPTLGYFTDLFTQGYGEFRDAGGLDLEQFQQLEETIFQQYQWGNPTAQANQLRIGHGYGYTPEESTILGIVHRTSGFLLYGADGHELPTVVGLLTARDPGFRAIKLPEVGFSIEVTDPAAQLILTTLRENFTDPVLIVDKGAKAYFENITLVNDKISAKLGQTILQQLKDSIWILAGFLLGNAASTILTKMGHPILVGIGWALKALMKAAEWLMNIDLIGTAIVTVVKAAEHLVRVTTPQKGKKADPISEGHFDKAAEILTPMLAQIAIAAVGWGLSKLIGGLRKGKGAAEIECSSCKMTPKEKAAEGKKSGKKAAPAAEPVAQFTRDLFRKFYDSYREAGYKPVGPERAIFPDPAKYPTVEIRPNGDVFGRYDEMVKYGNEAKVTGRRGEVASIESHHLLEDNYMKDFGIKRAEGRSVALEADDHGIFSKDVPEELGGRTPRKFFDIWELFNAHAKVYRENGHPEWVAEMIRFLRDRKGVIKDAYTSGRVKGQKLPDWGARLAKAIDFLDNL